ncbi:MAG: CpsD/CapB family tyrosine-protein kinase [Ileibacterium sp.]|nr:CpsD/CapB family tyrosine-protein kinase [Ileibacterium sp.]
MARKDKNTASAVPLSVQKETLADSLSFAGSEAYKQLRTNVMFSLPADKKSHVIAVTSAVAGDGKSTTAINLAYSLAQLKKKVLIIEADMRLPYMSKRLELQNAPGLSELLAGQKEANEILQTVNSEARFYAITAGSLPPNPAELLTSSRMKRYLNFFENTFDYIILDLPPVNLVTDAVSLAKQVDGYILVVRQDKTNLRSIKEAVEKLKIVDGKVLGFVMNDVKRKKGYGYKYHDDYNGYYSGQQNL